MIKYSLIALMPLLFLACSNESEAVTQQVLGKWKYDTQAILEEIRQHEDLTDNDIMRVEGAMSLYNDAVFTFQEEGKLELVVRGATQLGTWGVTDNGKTLILNLSGQDQMNPIESFTPDQLILSALPSQGILHKRIFIPVPTQD